MQAIADQAAEVGIPVAIMLGSILAGLIIHRLVFAVLSRVVARTRTQTDDLLVQHARSPGMLIVPLIVLFIVLPGIPLTPEAETVIRRLGTIATVIGIGWLLIAGLGLAADIVRHRFDVTAEDNLIARRMNTQVGMIRRIGVVLVVFLAGAGILMTFPNLRDIGVSLFASAGVAGLVVGFAARPTLTSLIAGLQIAFTDPIRIDDVVIVEGEWGWIEEINTTYVVVRIWDLRRLIVPLTYFIEHPFQNWTRRTADILGSVFLYADYTLPVAALRTELDRLVKSSPLWDGKVCVLQVTDARERTIELRALVSASTSPKAWDLRCMVREELIAYLRANHPHCLPKVRASLEPQPEAEDGAEAGPSSPSRAEAGPPVGGLPETE